MRPVAPLTDEAPLYTRPIADKSSSKPQSDDLQKLERSLNEDHVFAKSLIAKMLGDVGSKRKIYDQFDRHIGAKTVLSSDHGGAAVMWIRSEETKHVPHLGVALSAGCNERRVKNTPMIGAAEAVLGCARTIFAAGGRPLAVTDCLNFGSAEDPKVMREFSDSVDGISLACRELGVPVVSGNVSLYNSTDGASIHPTPMIGMVGRVDDVRRATPANLFRAKGSAQEFEFYLISPDSLKKSELSFAASLAAKNSSLSASEGDLTPIDWAGELTLAKCLETLRDKISLVAARAVSEGGAGVAVLKTIGSELTAATDVEILAADGREFFAEGGARYMICVRFSGDAPPLADHLSGIKEKILPIDLKAMRFHKRVVYTVKANWKVYIDNYMEGYHILPVHPGLAKILDVSGYTTSIDGNKVLQYGPLASDDNPYHTGGAAYYYQVFPNLMLNILPGRVQMNSILPVDADHCLKVFDFFFTETDHAKLEKRAADDLNVSDVVQHEDIGICEQVQKGLRSGTYNKGRICVQEELGVWAFQNNLRKAYRSLASR